MLSQKYYNQCVKDLCKVPLTALKYRFNHSTLSPGLVKVGDNTFPNLLTLLTGLFAGERDGSGAETGR